MGPWSDGTDVFIRRDTRELLSLLKHTGKSHMSAQQDGSPLQAKGRGLRMKPTLPDLALGFSSLQNYEKYTSVV